MSLHNSHPSFYAKNLSDSLESDDTEPTDPTEARREKDSYRQRLRDRVAGYTTEEEPPRKPVGSVVLVQTIPVVAPEPEPEPEPEPVQPPPPPPTSPHQEAERLRVERIEAEVLAALAKITPVLVLSSKESVALVTATVESHKGDVLTALLRLTPSTTPRAGHPDTEGDVWLSCCIEAVIASTPDEVNETYTERGAGRIHARAAELGIETKTVKQMSKRMLDAVKLRSKAARALRFASETGAASGTVKPQPVDLIVHPMAHDRAGDEARAALADHPDLYIGPTGGITANQNGIKGRPVLTAIAEPAVIVEYLAGVRAVRISTEDGDTPAPLPTSIARAILANPMRAGGWRHVLGIAHRPVMTGSGRLVTAPGYDDETKLILDVPTDLVVDVPDSPTRAEAVAALTVLYELVSDFPFASPADKAAWLAMVLTPLAREMYDGPSPLSAVDANSPGTGKSLLTGLISTIESGHPLVPATLPTTEEETRKTITSIACRGTLMHVFDNADKQVGGATLCAVLTSTMWTDRILGQSTMVELPWRTSLYITGNNIVIGGDATRRVLVSRIVAADEHPEDRTGFTFPDIQGHVRANRGKYLSAALTILRGYVVAGRPTQGLTTWGSYEAWSSIVRSAVMWVVGHDVAVCRYRKSNPEHDAISAILCNWSSVTVGGRATVSQLITKTHELDDMGRVGKPRPGPHGDVAEALRALDDRLRPRIISRILTTYIDRVVDGFRLRNDGQPQGSIRFRVERIAPPDA